MLSMFLCHAGFLVLKIAVLPVVLALPPAGIKAEKALNAEENNCVQAYQFCETIKK